MRWYKILDGETVVNALEIEEPMFVRRLRNGVIDLCNEAHAQGIVSPDQERYYQLGGKESMDVGDTLVAVEIYGTEYDEIVHGLPDPEDTEPEIPDGTPEETILTRKELTDEVTALKAANEDLKQQLLAAQILLGVAE
jgi:hypothetical protein